MEKIKFPKITIVTPSFNRKKFLESTIKSVLGQNYPNLEYIIIDGGSTDGSVDIIKKYSDQLAYWCSEPDSGMYEAIDKGFALSSGEIMGWINSDDMHFPWTLKTVALIFRQIDQVEWITSLFPALFNQDDGLFNFVKRGGYATQYFYKGFYTNHPLFGIYGYIQQESTFWKRSLYERAGNKICTAYKYAGDLELWNRFFKHSDLYGVRCALGGFRLHGNQITSENMEKYFFDTEEILKHLKNRSLKLSIERWMRRNSIFNFWPLSVMPSFGFIQKSVNIRWNKVNCTWEIYHQYI